MNRQAALSYLQNEFLTLATETGQLITDTGQGYGPAIDNALRALGYSDNQFATVDVMPDKATDFIALLEYYALRRFLRSVSNYADIRADAPLVDKKLNQIFGNIKTLLSDAQNEIERRGYGSNGMSLVRFNLDYLE